MSGETTTDLVLLVDDEKTILDVMAMGFKRAGLATKLAATAEEALALLETESFAAVVTDKNLPGQSGMELLRFLNEKHPHTARLLMTGFVSTDSVLEALRLGTDDYLLKPFESIMLVAERVKQAIKHRRVQADRERLVTELRKMEKALRSSESTAFQKVTEMDLLQNVMDLKVADVTYELTGKIAELQVELYEQHERLTAVQKTLRELAESAEGDLKRRLLAEAEILG